MEETLPRMAEWDQTSEDQERRAKTIRLMSRDPAAYGQVGLERLEDQEKTA